MRTRWAAWLWVGVLLMAVAAAYPVTAQGPVRIFGTNTAGQAVPIQVAADGTIKLTLAVSGYEFEGDTDDAYETTLAVVDPTADRTITFPDATGSVAVFANAGTTDVSVIFEGATANDFETTLTFTDPTADRTVTVPNATGTVVVLANAPTVDQNLVFEGATANDFETTLAFTDPTADRTITVPDLTGTLIALATVTVTDDGDGAVTFLGASAGFDEDLTLNLDDTENTGVFTSSTGLVTLNFSSIALQESGVGVLNADEIDGSSELLAIVDDETGTGVLVFGTAPVFTTSTTHGLIATQDIIKILPVTDDDRFTATLTVADLAGDVTFTLPATGGTFARTADKLSAFAATTSAELAGVVSDETGTGVVVLGTAPSFTTSIAVVGGGDTGTVTAAAGTITAAATGGSENISFVFTPKGTGRTTLTGGITGGCTGTPTAATAGVATTCSGPDANPELLLERIAALEAQVAALVERQR